MNDKRKKAAEAITKALRWSYDAAASGGPGFQNIEQLAASYQKRGRDPRAQAESLVRWQIGKAGAIGFITGLPGLPFLPATIPANLAAVFVLQLRMAGAIAVLGGYDPNDDQVRAFATMCLAGNGAKEIVSNVGVQLSKKAAEQALKKIPGKTLIEINKKVGFRLATKTGQTGIVNFGKAIPLIGGVVGAGFDATSTKIVGTIAIKTFIDE